MPTDDHSGWKRPRFSVEDLLIATALVAVGLALMKLSSVYRSPITALGWPLVGAGIFKPFKRALMGFYLGLTFVIVVMIGSLVMGW